MRGPRDAAARFLLVALLLLATVAMVQAPEPAYPVEIRVVNDVTIPSSATLRIVAEGGKILATAHLPAGAARTVLFDHEALDGNVRLTLRRDSPCPTGIVERSLMCDREIVSDPFRPVPGARFEWRARANIVQPLLPR